MTFCWQREQTPETLIPALRALAAQYDVLRESDATGIPLAFHQEDDLDGPVVAREDGRAVVRYATPAHALRGLGSLISGLVHEGETVREQLPFSSFGVMIDCSRNAVMKPDHIKRWMNQLALLGYNTVMLYTEDTYALPEEPYFGYLRGRYTAEDLQDLDQHAAALAIELIGCIQTLGHLETMFKWSPYWEIKDTPSILLVDHERTYALIDKMLAQHARVYRSRRIHIGMDETHDLGRGRFMDLFGHERGYTLFNRHLARVVELCKKHGLQPMLWSDMYFRMGNPTQDYYAPETRIPDDVKQAIPAEAQLVYWDYYHEDQGFYEDWIQRHRHLGHEPVMASGIWTWGGHFWYAHHKTLANVPPCVRACKRTGVKELFFTLWGDDGAYCEFDSALAGLAYAAELAASGDGPVHEKTLAQRFHAVCDADWDLVIQAAGIQTDIHPASLFWDDPLLGIYWKNECLKGPEHWTRVLRQFNRALRRLKAGRDQEAPIDFAHWCVATKYLRAIIKFRLALDTAYATRDTTALAKLQGQARRMPRLLEDCNQSFRRQWMRRNRPEGFETIQNRIGARKQRWLELATRIDELIAGHIDSIPELDEESTHPLTLYTRWRDVVSGGIG